MGEAWTTNLSVREVVPLIDVQVGLCWKGLSVECPYFRVVVLILLLGGAKLRYRKCRNIEKLWTAHSTDPEFRTEPMYSEF